MSHSVLPVSTNASLALEAGSNARQRAADLVEQAETAFLQDLPGLLHSHPQSWVAYHGLRQIGIATTKAELFQECLRAGLAQDEIVIWRIEQVIGEMTVGLGVIG